jgi:hypothetical protein
MTMCELHPHIEGALEPELMFRRSRLVSVVTTRACRSGSPNRTSTTWYTPTSKDGGAGWIPTSAGEVRHRVRPEARAEGLLRNVIEASQAPLTVRHSILNTRRNSGDQRRTTHLTQPLLIHLLRHRHLCFGHDRSQSPSLARRVTPRSNPPSIRQPRDPHASARSAL